MVEILAVMAIIGVLCAVATPNMSAMLKSYRLKSAAYDLASALQLAKMTAIAQNANSVVFFDVENQTYTLFSDNGAGGGTANDNTQSGNEPTIKTVNVGSEYSQSVVLGTPSFGSTVSYNSQGMCSTGGTIPLQNTAGQGYQIVLTLGGGIKVNRM